MHSHRSRGSRRSTRTHRSTSRPHNVRASTPADDDRGLQGTSFNNFLDHFAETWRSTYSAATRDHLTSDQSECSVRKGQNLMWPLMQEKFHNARLFKQGAIAAKRLRSWSIKHTLADAGKSCTSVVEFTPCYFNKGTRGEVLGTIIKSELKWDTGIVTAAPSAVGQSQQQEHAADTTTQTEGSRVGEIPPGRWDGDALLKALEDSSKDSF